MHYTTTFSVLSIHVCACMVIHSGLETSTVLWFQCVLICTDFSLVTTVQEWPSGCLCVIFGRQWHKCDTLLAFTSCSSQKSRTLLSLTWVSITKQPRISSLKLSLEICRNSLENFHLCAPEKRYTSKIIECINSTTWSPYHKNAIIYLHSRHRILFVGSCLQQ